MNIFDENSRRSPEDGTTHKCTSQGEYAGSVKYNASQRRWLAINNVGYVLGSYPSESGAASVVLDKFSIERWRKKKGITVTGRFSSPEI